ncbi:MAG: helix-turn-helix domain-containing protein [Lachnospiraceae bacterium]|nr:helix-turn-helix domain-containing protein [Lachnospiraceae bacterium]
MSHSRKIKEKHRYVYQQIAHNVNYFKRMRGLSTDQLAEKANMSVSHLTAVESPGSLKGFSIEIPLDIADALDVTLADLVKELK